MEREEAFLEGLKAEDTGRLIHIVSHQLKRTIFLSSHQDSGLTSMQNRILNFILLHTLEKPLYQKDIEKEFNIRKSTATEILKLMEKNRFIYLPGMFPKGRQAKRNHSYKKRLLLCARTLWKISVLQRQSSDRAFQRRTMKPSCGF